MEKSSKSADTALPPLSSQSIILTGPTASGKSTIALGIADRLNAEIVSLDSVAVYQGMDIGTAKPTPEQRNRVRHHMLDIVSPTTEFSVANYLQHAHACVADIESRGKRALFVGGTPMYLKGALYGFDPGPPADWDFRRAVEADLARYGNQALHQRLQQVDPLSAHRLPPTDVRRITRALEVAYLSGVPISHRQTQHESLPNEGAARLIGLSWPRKSLHARIEHRVAEMFRSGLVDEVRQLMASHVALSRTAATAVGYREVIEHLRDDVPIKSTNQLVLFHTRQLARRQETWFRSMPMMATITMDDEATFPDVEEKVVKLVGI